MSHFVPKSQSAHVWRAREKETIGQAVDSSDDVDAVFFVGFFVLLNE